ncbi:unnamed protein product [Urochloa humidicola]
MAVFPSGLSLSLPAAVARSGAEQQGCGQATSAEEHGSSSCPSADPRRRASMGRAGLVASKQRRGGWLPTRSSGDDGSWGGKCVRWILRTKVPRLRRPHRDRRRPHLSLPQQRSFLSSLTPSAARCKTVGAPPRRVGGGPAAPSSPTLMAPARGSSGRCGRGHERRHRALQRPSFAPFPFSLQAGRRAGPTPAPCLRGRGRGGGNKSGAKGGGEAARACGGGEGMVGVAR